MNCQIEIATAARSLFCLRHLFNDSQELKHGTASWYSNLACLMGAMYLVFIAPFQDMTAECDPLALSSAFTG